REHAAALHPRGRRGARHLARARRNGRGDGGMHRIVNDEALDALFRAARSQYAWLARPVSDTLLRAIWELVRLGPIGTAARPSRIVFVRSAEAKARLGTTVCDAARAGIGSAPVTAIVASPSIDEQGAA